MRNYVGVQSEVLSFHEAFFFKKLEFWDFFKKGFLSFF